MGAKHSQERRWERQVLIAIFQRDPMAWTFIQTRSDWRTRQIGVRKWTVLQAAVWAGNSELEALLLANGVNTEAKDWYGDRAIDLAKELPLATLETDFTVDAKANSVRSTVRLRV